MPTYIRNRDTSGQGSPRIASGSAAPVYGIFGHVLVGGDPASEATEVSLAQRSTLQYSACYALELASLSSKKSLTMYMSIDGVQQAGTESYGTSRRDSYLTMSVIGTVTLDAGTYTFQARVDPGASIIEQYSQFSGYILVGANSESSCGAV
jgi:hypothetical protein